MNSAEAKFILQACRPDGRDAGDPRFAEALAEAQRDPALAAWFAREQAFDAVVSAKLREVAPPAELRAAILAGARMSRRAAWWRSPKVIALAASIAIVAALTPAVMRTLAGPVGVEQLALGIQSDLQSDAHAPRHLGGLGALKALLADPQARLAGGLPLEFAQLRRQGCRTLKIAGRDVLEICFERGGEFHLYIARTSDFADDEGAAGEVANDAPSFREQGRVASVSWSDGKHLYTLVSDAGVEALRRVL